MLFDTQTLTRIIERSFDLSMNDDVPAETRAEYLAQGKRLRELMMRLFGARFDSESVEFKQATDAMHETHHALTQAADDPSQVSQGVGRLGELAGCLEKALAGAGKAVT